jgi:tetratricopeptide (TPR) repeat protein
MSQDDTVRGETVQLNADRAAPTEAARRAETFLQRGDPAKAEAEVTRAIEQSTPQQLTARSDWYSLRAQCRAQQGKLEAAVDDAQTASQMDSRAEHRHQLFMLRGALYLHQKHYRQAVEELTAAIDIEPHGVSGHRYRYLARRALGDADGARADYRIALADLDKKLETSPASVELRTLRAQILLEGGDLPGSAAEFARARASDLGAYTKVDVPGVAVNLPPSLFAHVAVHACMLADTPTQRSFLRSALAAVLCGAAAGASLGAIFLAFQPTREAVPASAVGVAGWLLACSSFGALAVAVHRWLAPD